MITRFPSNALWVDQNDLAVIFRLAETRQDTVELYSRVCGAKLKHRGGKPQIRPFRHAGEKIGKAALRKRLDLRPDTNP